MVLFENNYCQFHKSLRLDLTEEKIKFKKRYKQVTPAMKIGLTSSQLNWARGVPRFPRHTQSSRWRFLLVSPVPKTSL